MKLLALFLLSLLLPSAMFAPSIVKAENTGAGNVNIAFWEDVDNLNPHMGPTRADAVIFTYLYATLCDIDEDLNIMPWLAESWEIINQTRWKFHLVENATWHDGQPFTAYDVEFTFSMLINGSANFPGMWFSTCKDVDKVTALDQYTVIVDMKLPRAQTLDFVGRAVPIVPKHIYENLPEPYKSEPWIFLNMEHPIGCGPFKFKSRTPGQQIVLESNQNFFRLKYRPKINTMTFNVIQNLDVALLALHRGDIDVVLQEVSPSVFYAIRSNPAAFPMIKTSNVSDISTSSLAFNMRLFPYNITNFRRAISHAIDINRIIDKIWLGYAIPGSPGYAPPKWSWYNPNIPPYGYNLTLAEELFDQAGFHIDTNGKRVTPDGSPFTMKILCENDEVSLDIATYIKNDLSKAGLDVTIDAKDTTSVYTILRDKRTEWETALTLTRNSYNIYADTPDTTYFYRFHSSRSTGTGWNINGFENTTYDKLVESMIQNFNSTDRQQQIFRAQEILASEMPRVSLYHRQILNVYRDDHLTGWTAVVGLGFHNFYNWANLQEVTTRSTTNTTYQTEYELFIVLGVAVVVVVIVALMAIYFIRKRSGK